MLLLLLLLLLFPFFFFFAADIAATLTSRRRPSRLFTFDTLFECMIYSEARREPKGFERWTGWWVVAAYLDRFAQGYF